MVAGLARIHKQNLINYGILPLLFESETDRELLARGANVKLESIRDAVAGAERLTALIDNSHRLQLKLDLSRRDREILLAGGRIPWFRKERASQLTGSR